MNKYIELVEQVPYWLVEAFEKKNLPDDEEGLNEIAYRYMRLQRSRKRWISSIIYVGAINFVLIMLVVPWYFVSTSPLSSWIFPAGFLVAVCSVSVNSFFITWFLKKTNHTYRRCGRILGQFEGVVKILAPKREDLRSEFINHTFLRERLISYAKEVLVSEQALRLYKAQLSENVEMLKQYCDVVLGNRVRFQALLKVAREDLGLDFKEQSLFDQAKHLMLAV